MLWIVEVDPGSFSQRECLSFAELCYMFVSIYVVFTDHCWGKKNTRIKLVILCIHLVILLYAMTRTNNELILLTGLCSQRLKHPLLLCCCA